eukprot:scaffold62358_cov18-Tisochrysis_lutea.AAC.1
MEITEASSSNIPGLFLKLAEARGLGRGNSNIIHPACSHRTQATGTSLWDSVTALHSPYYKLVAALCSSMQAQHGTLSCVFPDTR